MKFSRFNTMTKSLGFNKKTILVCGGAGFIGSNFVHYILSKYPKVKIVNFDKLTYSGNLDNLKDIEKDKRYSFVKGDIVDQKKVSGVFKKYKPDYIINFAAESIAEDVYVPIHSTLGIRMVTFKKFWDIESKRKNIVKTDTGEAIFFDEQNHNVKVLSFLNGGQWMPVKAITRHWYKGKIVRLLQKHAIVSATPNHSVYASNLELTNPDSNPELLVVRNVNEIRRKPIKASNDYVKFIAAFVAEGSTCFNKANGSYIVEIGQKDKKWLEDIGKCAKREWRVNYNIVMNSSSGVYRMQISNKKLHGFLRKECGTDSLSKKFPSLIFSCSDNQRDIFWNKLLEGDGTKDGRYTTVSVELANQLSLLLALMGIKFTVFERKFRNEKWNDAYEIKTGKENHYGLNDKSKEEIDYDGWVYDLSVDKTHNFICGLGNAVCHNTHVDRSIHGSSLDFIKTNIEGVFNIAEGVKASPSVVKYVQVSTDEVHGSLPLDSKERFNEYSLFSPNVPYAATKAGGDLLCRAYFSTWKVPVVVTHCSNNYGPNQYPEKIIPFFVTRMLEGKKLPLYGDGRHVRDWVYVLDHCRALELCLIKGAPGGVYHIGADNEIDNTDIARRILKYFGRDESWIEYVSDRPGHDRRYSIDSTKIREQLGWKPVRTFEKAFNETIQWYIDNSKWIHRVRKRTGVFNPHIDLWRAHTLHNMRL